MKDNGPHNGQGCGFINRWPVTSEKRLTGVGSVWLVLAFVLYLVEAIL